MIIERQNDAVKLKKINRFEYSLARDESSQKVAFCLGGLARTGSTFNVGLGEG